MVLYRVDSGLLRGTGEQELIMEKGADVMMYSLDMIV